MLVIVWLLYAYCALDFSGKLTVPPPAGWRRVWLVVEGLVLLLALLWLLRGWWT